MSIAVFFPKGIVWVGFIALVVGSAQSLSKIRGQALALPIICFVSWLTLSLVWSQLNNSQTWLTWFYYSLIGLIPVFTAAMQNRLTADTRQRALDWFMAASVVASALLVYHAAIGLPDIKFFRYITIYDGNKAILFQVFAALGCGFLLSKSLQKNSYSPLKALLAMSCLLALMFVALSRTALVLVLACAVIAIASCALPRTYRIFSFAALLAIFLAIAAVSPIVQTRLSTALAGIQNSQTVDKNNSMNVRSAMNQQSIHMIQTKPLLGHGLGSWTRQWEDNKPTHGHGSSITSHNEYFGLAAQAGLPAGAFIVWVFLAMGASCLRLPKPYVGYGLMVTTTWLIASGFNATLRDITFSIPFIFLTALTWSLSRDSAH